MFKCHHALADGMSLIGLIASMQENYSKEMMYEFRPKLSCCGRLCLVLCTPLIMLRALVDIYFFQPIQKNVLTLKDGEEYSGIKRGAIGESFSIKDLKLAAKSAGVTVNDFIMAILSVSMQKYFVSKGKPEQEITLNLPGSHKKLADSAK